MPDIGRPTPTGVLNLPTVGDFSHTFEWGGGTFPEGSKLYYLLGDVGTTQQKWSYVIVGAVASIKKESDVVAAIAVDTKFWLVFETPTAPTTEEEILTGKVKKVNAR